MKDLIERQAAIDALMKRDKELRNINWYDKPFAEGECKGIDYALEIVNALPSVQPTQSNASNALKTLDCIDRQAAIDKLDPLFESLAIDKIKALPSAQPERWIPCSERLPEESGLYIVTNVGRWVEPVGTRYYNIRADGGFWSGHPGDKVLAWMPLPEAYKEVTE